jgi:dolichyl-phosphate beta-glucosyltransferase
VLRRVLGWTFNKIARTILWMPYRDTQAGLKAFRLDAARRIFALQRVPGFSFDAELIFIARRLGYSVGEIPARVSDTHSYKISKVNLAREPFRMLRELVRIRGNALLGRYGKKGQGSRAKGQGAA